MRKAVLWIAMAKNLASCDVFAVTHLVYLDDVIVFKESAWHV
jgi:hypothetical protein